MENRKHIWKLSLLAMKWVNQNKPSTSFAKPVWLMESTANDKFDTGYP